MNMIHFLSVAASLAAAAECERPAPPSPEQVQALVKDLASPDPEVREKAIDALAEFGHHASNAVPGLVKALGDDVSSVRFSAELALGEIGPAAAPHLIPLVRSDKARLREGAVRALNLIRPYPPAATPALIQALGDGDPVVRSIAASTLATGKVKAALPGLLKMAKSDPDPETSRGVFFDIGIYGPDAGSVIPGLIEILEDPDAHHPFRVDRVAPSSVSALTPNALLAAETLAQIGPKAAPPLANTFTNPNAHRSARLYAGFALGQLGEKVAELREEAVPIVESVVGLIADPDEGVQDQAILTLIEIGKAHKKGAIPALKKVMKTYRDPSLRSRAAVGVYQLAPNDPSAVAALIREISDPNTDPYDAAECLEEIGPGAAAAVPALIRLLGNKDEINRRQAARALGKIGPAAKEAIPALEALGRETKDPDTKSVAAEAIERIKSEVDK